MYTFCLIVVVLAAVLMCGIVLIQESKGGGLASSFASSNQIMGVRKTTDFVEKATWTLVIVMMVGSVLSAFFLPRAGVEESVIMNQTIEQQAVNPNNVPSLPTGATPAEATPAVSAE